MKKIAMFALSAAVLASSSAFAQGLTRNGVNQQLVQEEQDGSRFVTNASYPDVSPVYADQAARLKAPDATGFGAIAAGTSASGSRIAMSGGSALATCVGPNSFCNLYAGS